MWPLNNIDIITINQCASLESMGESFLIGFFEKISSPTILAFVMVIMFKQLLLGRNISDKIFMALLQVLIF